MGQAATPEPGRPARVSAIVTQQGAPADGIIVELYDGAKKTILGREKTDFQGFVQFDNDTSYLPVVLRVVPPAGMVASPAEQKTITMPLSGGIFNIKEYFYDNWDVDESVRFQIGIPAEMPSSRDASSPAAKEDEFDLGKYLTLKNIAIAAGVFILGMILYNRFVGSDD